MVNKILFIHNEKGFKAGAYYVNNLIVNKLRSIGYLVDCIYPIGVIDLFSKPSSGIHNILSFYSLINRKNEIDKYDIIQGTTYTTIAFLRFKVPVISHFGSTANGAIKNIPCLEELKRENKHLIKIFDDLLKQGVIDDFNVLDKKSIKDISEVEMYVAKRSDLVVSSSKKVKQELITNGVPMKKVVLIHNAIEDYWFKFQPLKMAKSMVELVYLGRLGDDPFTVKLKGVDRLLLILEKFPNLRKTIIGMCNKVDEYSQIFSQFPNTHFYFNVEQKNIPKILRDHYGDIFINPSRYEGFCLSLIEAMSQGLVPITFPTGVAPEIIRNEVNGYLVNSINEIIEKINFLASKKVSRARMAEEAIKTSNFFNSDMLIKKHLDVYRYIKNKKSY